MPDWCPKCRAMLPEGLAKCPACGARLSQQGDLNLKEVAWISGYIMRIIAIPVLIALVIGLICVITIWL